MFRTHVTPGKIRTACSDIEELTGIHVGGSYARERPKGERKTLSVRFTFGQVRGTKAPRKEKAGDRAIRQEPLKRFSSQVRFQADLEVQPSPLLFLPGRPKCL